MNINLNSSLLMTKSKDVNFGKKNKNENPIETQNPENPKSLTGKIRNSAISSYVAALMALGATTPMVTSCIQMDQDVNIDTKQFQELLEKLLEEQKKNNEQNDAMTKILVQILNEVKSGNLDIKDAINRLIALVQQGLTNDAELIALITKINNDNQISQEEKWNQILSAINEVTKAIENLSELVKILNENVSNGDKDLANTIKAWMEKYEKNEIQRSEMMDKIFAAIMKSNELSSEMIAKITELIKQGEANHTSDADLLGQIINLLQSIDGKLDGLKESVDGLGDKLTVGNEKVSDLIKEFMEEYKKGNATGNELLTNILNTVLQSNLNDEKMMTQFEDIKNLIASGQMTLSEAMDKVIELLGQIKDNTQAIKDAIDKLTGEISKLATQMQTQHTETKDILNGIKANTTDISNTTKKALAISKKSLATQIEMSDKLDKLHVKLEEMNKKMFTLDEVKELLGPAFDQILIHLGNISGNQISLEQIEAAMAKYQTDLSKTNSLIETLTTVVQNINLTGGMTDELKAIVALLQSMKDMNAEQLTEIITKLAGMQGSLDAIVTTAAQVQKNQETFMNSATLFGTKFFEELQKISDNMINKDVLATYAKNYKEYLIKADQAREQQLILIQAAIENIGKGQAVDIDELIKKLPNYTTLLNEIKDKLGNLVTKDDIKDFPVADLTKVCTLIETLTIVVQNKDFGGSGNVDMAEANRLLGELLDMMAKGQLETAKQWEEFYTQNQKLLDEIMKIAENTKPTTPPANTKSLKHNFVAYNDTPMARELVKMVNQYQHTEPQKAELAKLLLEFNA